MVSGCSALFAHLCTLEELAAAYHGGYRQPIYAWLYFADPQRDAMMFEDGCGTYSTRPGECHHGAVANTPRPEARARAICCTHCCCRG